jgi:hypothetical protein
VRTMLGPFPPVGEGTAHDEVSARRQELSNSSHGHEHKVQRGKRLAV